VIGMITRKDLLAEHIEERLERAPRTHVWENHSIKLDMEAVV